MSIEQANIFAAIECAREATSVDLPCDRIIRFEDQLESGRRVATRAAGEWVDSYDALQWTIGVRGFFRYLIADGIEVYAILPRLWAVGARWMIEGYALTLAERRWMFGDNDRAIGWRLRLIFGGDDEAEREQWEAIVRFVARTGYHTAGDMRFDEFLSAEDDGFDFGAPGEEEIRLRRMAVRGLLQHCARGLDGSDALKGRAMRIMRELWTLGRGARQQPFASMTMDEAGAMLDETKSNHSHRGKQLSRMIEKVGMRGSQLPGQKGKHASASYRVVAKRTCNRREAEKSRRRFSKPQPTKTT